MGKASAIRWPRSVAALATMVLVAGLAAMSPPAVAEPGGLDFVPAKSRPDAPQHREPAQRGQTTVRTSGALTSRPTGMPTTTTPARRLVRASAVDEVLAERFTASFVLGAVPTSSTDGWMTAEYGYFDDNTCYGYKSYTTTTLAAGNGFTRSGTQVNFSASSYEAGYAYDCAFVYLSNADGSAIYDVLIGALKPTYAPPRLQFGKVRTQRLVHKATTRIDVPIRNIGLSDAEHVTISGKGKGLKVRTTKVSYPLLAESTYSSTVSVPITLKAKNKVPKRTKIKLVATTAGSRTTTTVRVVRIDPPPRPKPGKYEGKKTSTTFQIDRSGKVRGFRAYLSGYCGILDSRYPTSGWYSFKTTKVPRNGIVDDVEKGELYTVYLRMQFKGSKVVNGTMRYSGPNYCSLSGAVDGVRKR
ncbi:hypothetical protein [Nocardioides sp. GXZ039]|uniref:hypothetical protein n=1 Tax=Nocardioides sp. GXZ039 TaxID=3136018 RepID=UPI0030F4AF40